MMPKQEEQDKFMAMVSAKADVQLPLSAFHPRCMLTTARHEVPLPRFPVMDYHNHLDAQEPAHVLEVMDACGVEHMVNITMKVGDEALAMMERYLRDASGELVRVDDERLAPIFERAGELGIPVMVHIGDPEAFFLPIDANNERYEELAAHPDWSFYGSRYGKHDLLEQRDRVFQRHPRTTFVGAHIAENSEDLQRVSAMLDACPNVWVDISARASELGRQPYSARKFFLRYADRILFGTDLVPEVEMYRLYYRFLETADEYFEYPTHASGQGRWSIYGMDLPEEVLRKVYRENALRLLPHLR